MKLPDGTTIAVETWVPTPTSVIDSTSNDASTPTASATAGPTVYLVHGWGGWRGQLGAFVNPLIEAGCRVVSFDVPSHGDSSPGMVGAGRATGIDFSTALTAVVGEYGHPDGLVAHSMGCATTTMAIRDGLTATRLVFVAPSPDPIATLDTLEATLGYGPRTRRFLYERLSRLAARPLGDFNAFTVTSDDDLPPAMIIHDRDDKEAPYDDGARLAAIWPETDLVTTEGLGHQRILLDTGVIKLATDYLTTPLP
ncbi:alpha/beta hydrolase [Phytoactinopolyspora limicola]|uniref:alpha/beta hydrolase n=1 Tax=Phytoactinopolyspora limicola TaxID=2715536 RepID=UPI0014075515|nr:alpha/beta fold hydrolase [Phytoactinopolyspora limicola]